MNEPYVIPCFGESDRRALYNGIQYMCTSWSKDPMRYAMLDRLLNGDESALPYFRNLLVNTAHNSSGEERSTAVRLLKSYFNVECLP